MSDTQSTAVITGASTGIGRAIARSLIDNGWRVFGSVRKPEDAETLRQGLGENFTSLIFDVTDFTAIREASATVSDALEGRTLNALVNNAGIAVAGPLRHIPLEEVHRQFDVNIFGVVRVTQAFLPMLGADPVFKGPPGRIINMSSVAGKIASPILGPYAMSKHALEAFSDSLRRELLMHGIDVITVGPGAIKTPIWAKADDIDVAPYKDTEYYGVIQNMRKMLQEVGDNGLEPAKVGDLALRILTTDKPKTRYAIMKNQFVMWTLLRALPQRMIDRAAAKRVGLPQEAQNK